MNRTRRSLRIESAVEKTEKEKENVELNNCPVRNLPRTPKSQKRVNSTQASESSPPKTTRTDSSISLSPISEKLQKQLTIGSQKNGNKFRSARRALCTFDHDLELPGRENEAKELIEYFNNKIELNASGSIYISGSPGTGKSATILKLINSSELKAKFQMVYVNCTSISSIGSIYKKICAELNLKIRNGATEKEFLRTLESYLLEEEHKTVMLVLDEIDQLMGKKQTVLYRIFEWPALPESNIILVGIANQLDLTERSLSRLSTRCELKPKLMHFPPYTRQQIVGIFKSRLQNSNASDLFPPHTIELLAAKVSAVSGDIRRALNIGNRVIEIAEAEKRKNVKKLDMEKITSVIENDGDQQEKNEDANKKSEEVDKEEAPATVQMKDVLTVLNNVYGTSQSLENDLEEAFPIQQKILICTIVLIIKNDKNKDVTVGRLHDIYKKICKNLNVDAIDQSEFMNLCTLVETRGIIRIQKKKEPRFSRLFLEWDENEVWEALKDKQMINSILSNKNVLNKK